MKNLLKRKRVKKKDSSLSLSLSLKKKLQKSRELSDQRFLRAFPGDTYISDLHKASKTGKPWIKIIPAVIIIAFAADYWLLTDTFSMAFQSGFWVTYFVPISLIISYLALGYLAGKKMAEWRSLRRSSALKVFSLLFIVEILVLIFLGILRCYGEVIQNGGMGGSSGLNMSFNGAAAEQTLQIGNKASSTGLDAFFSKVSELGVDVIFPAVALSLIMLIGAMLGMYYAYCSYDAFAGEKKHLAESYIAEDRQLYEKAFYKAVNLQNKTLDYERRERDLDKKAVATTFKVNSLATQLNGIVDPADAYDFCKISKSITDKF